MFSSASILTEYVIEALDDFPHCELRHVLCTEFCFHNDLRLPIQSSSILGFTEFQSPIQQTFEKKKKNQLSSIHHRNVAQIFFSTVNCTSAAQPSQL